MAHEDELVTIAKGDYPKEGEPCVALAGKREDIASLLDAVLENQWKMQMPQVGFTITMPCGYNQVFTSPSDIPNEDLPCPCKREGHFLIKLS